MAEEPPRERLFDVLMRRLEVMAPQREAVRSLMRSARRNPPLTLALNGLAVRSQQWMLTAAGIKASGPRGMMRAQGLAVMFAAVLRTWVNDDDPGLARTMAALDRALGRGQRLVGLVEDICQVPWRLCRLRSRWRRRHDEDDGEEAEEPAAACAGIHTGVALAGIDPDQGCGQLQIIVREEEIGAFFGNLDLFDQPPKV